jgi:hypothetical protein
VNRRQRLRLGRGLASVAAAYAIGLVGSAAGAGARAATLIACPGTAYTTIQSAVNAAAPGDTVQVCEGTFPEQVVIPAGKNDLTLVSQTPYSTTATGAIIKAPPTLPANQQSAIVEVAGATGVTISGFTISGPAGAPGCGCIGYGVLVDQSGSATVTGNHIVDIHDNPSISGNQNGVGIGAGCCLPTPGASSGSITATKNTIDAYQKAAIDIRGVGSLGALSDNVIHGAGSTSVIGQNGIQISRGASGTVTGNTVSDNEYQPQTVTGTGIVVLGPVGDVTVSNNKFLRNDGNIYVYNVKTSKVAVGGNATINGLYGIIVDASTGAVVDKNVIAAADTAGLNAGPDAAGNSFTNNIAAGTPLPGHDCLDESKVSSTAGTANTWTKNLGDTRSPEGICSEAPIDQNPPPVIVLPSPPGSGPPVPAGPPGQEVGNKIITKMRGKQLRSCLIEVRSVGPRRVLVARGLARAPAKGTGRLVVRINVKPRGKTLLAKNFGGVMVNVRALCRSTSGTLHRATRRIRALLLIEHRLTPPGSWVPDQPILTGIGLTFMSYLQHRMFSVRAIRCDGYTATWPPSPAFPATLSLNRARRVCGDLKRFARRARVRLVPRGLTDPIATNATEAGRRVNRRVFVTIVHVFVFRS